MLARFRFAMPTKVFWQGCKEPAIGMGFRIKGLM